MHKVIPLFFSLFLISNSTIAMDGPTLVWKEDTLDIQKKDLHAAKYLKTPFIRQSIKNYSEQCGTSPFSLALIRCFGDEGAPENLKDLTPVLTIAKPLAEQSVAAQIDPLFRDVGLGTYYVIAKK